MKTSCISPKELSFGYNGPDFKFLDFRDAPACPYTTGFTTTIKEHEPPAPFGQTDYEDVDHLDMPYLRSLTRTEAVAKIPLRSGPDQAHNPIVLDLCITKIISGGILNGPQIVLCTLAGKNRPVSQAVAKIYDPLYSRVDPESLDLMRTGFPPFYETLDVVYRSDGEYSRETAAYREIQQSGATEGLFTPKYYGSWTFSIPIFCTAVPKVQQRDVRLILIEHIDGTSMSDLGRGADGRWDRFRYADYHESYREAVWAQVIDGVSRVRQAGIDQGDLEPQNIVITPKPDKSLSISRQSMPRAVLVDFGNSTVWRRTPENEYGSGQSYPLPLPYNPIETSWYPEKDSFKYWWPEGLTKMFKYREWLVKKFGESDQYKPVERPLDVKWEEPHSYVPKGGWPE